MSDHTARIRRVLPPRVSCENSSPRPFLNSPISGWSLRHSGCRRSSGSTDVPGVVEKERHAFQWPFAHPPRFPPARRDRPRLCAPRRSLSSMECVPPDNGSSTGGCASANAELKSKSADRPHGRLCRGDDDAAAVSAAQARCEQRWHRAHRISSARSTSASPSCHPPASSSDVIIRPRQLAVKSHFGKKCWASMDTLFEIKLDLTLGDRARRPNRSIDSSRRPSSTAGWRQARSCPYPHVLTIPRVSRNTAAAVYERLASDDLVLTRRGSGSYVAATSRAARTRAAGRTGRTARAAQKPGARSADQRLNRSGCARTSRQQWTSGAIRTRHAARATAASIDFRPALIDSRLFPFDLFRQVSVKQLRQLESRPAITRARRATRVTTHCVMPSRATSRSRARSSAVLRMCSSPRVRSRHSICWRACL